MLGIYEQLKLKVENLKKAAADGFYKGKDLSGLKIFQHRLFLLNLNVLFWEAVLNFLKFIIIITQDSAVSFNLLFRNSGLQYCFYSYNDFKKVRTKIRKFSAAGFFAILVSTVITTLLVNLFFGTNPGAFAGTYTFQQSQWIGTPTGAAATHAGNNDSGFADYTSKDSGIALSGGVDPYNSVTLQSTSGSVTQTSDNGSADTPNAGGFNAGTMTDVAVSGTGSGAKVVLTSSGGGVSTSQSGAGREHSCALSEDGTVYCWGDGTYGQIGDGFQSQRTTPVRVKKGAAASGDNDGTYLTNIKSISAQGNNTCVVSNNNNIYCWGANSGGQIGDGTTTLRSSPVRVVKGAAASGDNDGTYLTNIKSVSIKSFHHSASGVTGGVACAVSNNNNMYCWGSNDRGQLGDGTTTQRTSPVRVVKGAAASGDNDGTYLTNIENVGVSDFHSCAVSNNNNIYCWGYNANGQLGDGTTTQRTSPVRVVKGAAASGDNDGTYLTNVSSIGLGSEYDTDFETDWLLSTTCAASNNGNLYCWGVNGNGQLGDGTTTQRTSPVRVVKGAAASGDNDGIYLTNIKGLAVSNVYACAVSNNDNLYCWGKNSYGQLGDGTITQRTSPIRVAKGLAASGDNDGTYLTNVKSVNVGSDLTYNHTCAVSNNNNVYCWGYNGEGEIGDASSSNRYYPIQVHGVGNSGYLSLASPVTYSTSGTFVSPVIDSGQNTSWNDTSFTLSGTSGTETVAIQVRSCDDASCSSAGDRNESATKVFGTNCSNIASGQSLSTGGCMSNGDRYIQYRAVLAGSGSATPSLDDIVLNHAYYPVVFQKLISSPFDSGDIYNSISRISWTNSGSGTAKYQIRSADSQVNLSSALWCGPNSCDATPGGGTSDFYTASNGSQAINSGNSDRTGDRWFQYAMFLASNDGSDAPVLDEASVQYNFNEPPLISSFSASQDVTDSANVDIAYNIKDFEDDQTTAEVLLFYQPSGLTLNGAINDTTGTSNITVNNSNSFTIPSSGQIFIDNELISYTGKSGNTLTGISRGQNFADGFMTDGATHSDVADVFFKATQIAAQGTPGVGTVTTTTSNVGKTATWNAKNETNLNGNNFSGMTLKLVANDGQAYSRVRATSLSDFTLDLENPSLSNITTGGEVVSPAYYNASDSIDLILNFSETISSGSGTVSLNSGGSCNFSVSGASSATCTYTVGPGENAANLSADSVSGSLTDAVGNVRTNPSIGTNLPAQGKTIKIDTASPGISDLAPGDNAFINSITGANGGSDFSYSLSETIQSGTVTFTRISGTADSSSPRICNLVGTALEQGNHYGLNLSDTTNACTEAQSLVNGTVYNLAISVTDLAGNASSLSRNNVIFDTTAPTLSSVSVQSNNSNDTSFAKTGDEITLSFTSDETLGSLPVVSIAGNAVVENNISNNGNDYAAVYEMTSSASEGEVSFSVDFSDRAGNSGLQVTSATDSSSVTFDKTAPSLQSFDSNTANPATAYGSGQEINIQARFNESVGSGSTMTVVLDNTAQYEVVLDQIDNSGGIYRLYGTYTVQQTPGRTHDTSDLNIESIQSSNVRDIAGNTSTSTDMSSVVSGNQNLADNKDLVIDTGPPILQSFSANAGAYNSGDAVAITATYNETLAAGSQIVIKLNTDNGSERNQEITLNSRSGTTISGTYTVGADHNADSLQITSIASQDAIDSIGNHEQGNSLVGISNLAGVQVDTVDPVASISDDVAIGPVPNDEITISVVEENPGVYKYVFSADTNCSSKNYASGNSFSSNVPTTVSDEGNNGKYVCFKAIDDAGNTDYLSSSNVLNIDATQPTGTISIDASLSSGQIQITADDGARGVDGLTMKIETLASNDDECSFTGDWEDYASSYDLPGGAGSATKACVKFKDLAGNVSQVYETTNPGTPVDFQISDISNLELTPSFRGAFLTWQSPDETGTDGIDYFDLKYCSVESSEADCVPQAGLDTVDYSEPVQNYYETHDGLAGETKYCYRLRFKDNHGNYSPYSNTKCFVPGSGPIIDDTDVSIPNSDGDIIIDSIEKTSARISFRTEDSNDSNAPLATKATLTLYTDLGLAVQAPVGPFTDSTQHYNVDHVISMTDLTPGTTYYVKITATDSSSLSNSNRTQNLAYASGANSNLMFTAKGRLTSISTPPDPPSVLTDKKAVITFTTDQPAECTVEYGTSSGNYTEVPISETEYTLSHSIHLPGLVFSTKYYYKITCEDDMDTPTVVNSDEYYFTTLDTQMTRAEADAGDDSDSPEISNISVANITGESATITWDTDEDSNSLVKFGISGVEENVAGNAAVNFDVSNYVTSHSVIIRNLISSTKYKYAVGSVDTSGNIAESSEESFTTKAPSALSSIKVVSKNLNQAVITWKTDEETTSVVEYGLDTDYGETKENKSKAKEHSITLTGLESKQTYHFRVKGEDADGDLYSSSDYTFEPKSPPQIDDLKVGQVSEHGAKITFKTDVPTDALITYADVEDVQSSGSQGKPDLTSKHEIELKGLASGTTYSLKIRVRDESGNETEENFPNFTTGKDSNPPKIDKIKTDSALAQNDKVQTIISWITDEPADSRISYREGRSGEEKELKINESMAENHLAVVTTFKPGTVYYFKVKSADDAGNLSVSQDFALLTPRRKENIIQIIIGNFEDIFKWANFK